MQIFKRILLVSRGRSDAAGALTAQTGGALDIVSCWDYAFEDFLRHSTFGRLPEDRIIDLLVGAQARHRAALDGLIARAGIAPGHRVTHLRGEPDRLIPAWIDEHGCDLLILGTVARSGIAGFVIGNTAENVVQKVRCSLLAVQPAESGPGATA